jgi:hypothetical protein
MILFAKYLVSAADLQIPALAMPTPEKSWWLKELPLTL